jgi:hypothetical protein
VAANGGSVYIRIMQRKYSAFSIFAPKEGVNYETQTFSFTNYDFRCSNVGKFG